MPALCPHCKNLLSGSESRLDNCPVCSEPLQDATGTLGKSTAPVVTAQAEWRSSRRNERGAPARTHEKEPRSRASLGGYFMVMGGVVIGSILSIAATGGSTGLLWLGCGVGAGGGAALAQALGMWPRKIKKGKATA